MADMDVIQLPVRDDGKPTKKKKRAPPPNLDPEEEERKRQRNVTKLAVLGEEDGAVKRLETLVFGAEDELLDRLAEEDEEQTGDLLLEEGGEEESWRSEGEEETHHQPQTAAWVDEDDEQEEEVDMTHRYRRNLMKGEAEATMSKQKLQQRMKEQFQKSMGGTPAWAQSSEKRKRTADEEEEEEEDDLLRRTGNFVASSESLPSGILRMKKCLHANSARPSEDRLTTVQFHPSAQVVMTAGLDQSISLFQVDGKTNPKIQSIHLERFPVHKAQFSQNGETVIATSLRNKMFYLYDMMEGRVSPVHAVRGLNEARVMEFSVCPDGGALLLTGTNGYLHLLTLKTKEVVRSMKINGDISGVAFSHDGSKVFANSEEGEVYVWDMRSSRCVNRFTDEGCVKGTSIAASRNGRYLACGSQSGVVNIYSQEACLNSASPRPLRTVMNLLTSATSLTFNPTSDILAIASRMEDEAVRMVHLPSLTVFSNFPVSKRKIVHRASCLDFSPNSGFFSLANNKGHAPLFRLLHYKDF
ncbi:U3 small nucleolar RNA-associated protein 18 homolog [Melanotaenia boesemani]|uniref:U3 small nucleolar RNA-associated protein 18 homolog n=1 Tax=Melanotaenia boesemani TaxID=1250792 RepID=UPI001C04D2D9|nr:U3 small nucleolar RNA-associated protein 18 homolog [Melanotaenia boesemani]